MTNAHRRFQLACEQIFQDYPFWATHLGILKIIESYAVPTCATDGEHLWWNPDWFEELNQSETMGVLIHELEHISRGHCLRLDTRDEGDWNIAADIEVNNHLLDQRIVLPQGGVWDHQYGQSAAEEIYPYVRTNKPKGSGSPPPPCPPGTPTTGGQGPAVPSQARPDSDAEAQGEPVDARGDDSEPGDDNGAQNDSPRPGSRDPEQPPPPLPPPPPNPGGGPSPPRWGRVTKPVNPDGTPLTPVQIQERLADVQITNYEAEKLENSYGNSPGNSIRSARGVKVAVDPRAALFHHLLASVHADRSYQRTSRRYTDGDIIMPGNDSLSLGNVAVGIDVSGSITLEQFQQMAGWLDEMFASFPETRVTAVYCNTQVTKHEEFTKDDVPVMLSAPTGGGTAFQPVFDWIADNYDEPINVMLYMTDLAGPAPREPDYPVVWVCTSPWRTEGSQPFGEMIWLPKGG